MPCPRLLPVVLALLASACGDLKEFSGRYRGPIVTGSFVRSCFSDATEAELRFDPEQAVAHDAGTAPNVLTTSDGTFQQTVLVPIRNLQNDHLSLLDFPGPQRLRSYLLLARPEAGPLAGRDALVVISLLASEGVELRVMGRTADATASCAADAEGIADAGSAPDAPREYFGLFRMKRR